MKVQVFGILILTQVGQHASRAVFGDDFGSDLFDRVEQFNQQLVVVLFERQQGVDVSFENDDDVNRPERSSVVERQHVFCFQDFTGAALSQQS